MTGRSLLSLLPSVQIRCFWLSLVLLFSASAVSAATRYVWQGSPSPAPPYDSWVTAATVIQDAVDAADPGDTVLVAGGVYATGGRAVYGTMTNRVAIDRAITVESLMGPEVTIIQGYQVPGTTNGDGAIRCVYLSNGASLSGFTLTNGHTRTAGDQYREASGGGGWGESSTAVLSNCVLTGNSARYDGGGTHRCTLNNCTLTGNSASTYGGGAAYGILNNCTLSGNSAFSGGGASFSTMNNCTLTSNFAIEGGGTYFGDLNHCRLTSNSGLNGGGANSGNLNNCTLIGNSADNGGGAYLGTLTNCTAVGNSAFGKVGGTALCSLNNCIVYFNKAASQPNYAVSPGNDLNYSCTTPLPAGRVGNIDLDPLFVDTNGWSNLRLQSNSPCINAGNNAYVTSSTDLDGNPRIVGGAVDMGAYENQTPAFNVRYVWQASPSPAAPFESWPSAAHTIQQAVDVSQAGDHIVVTNGVYATGGRAVGTNLLVNRVSVDKPLNLLSVNGPEVTIIQGYQVPGTINGDEAIRCVYLTNGASLSGFTLTNGATRSIVIYSAAENSGGGVLCESTNATVSNCVLIGNAASGDGGGVYRGTLNHCTLSGNSAQYGGGAYLATLNHCTLTGNSAAGSMYSHGGGAGYSTLNHCIVYYNNVWGVPGNYSLATPNYCCTIPLPTGGIGNITNAPRFVDTNGWSDLRLQSDSPCINAGNNAYVTDPTDLDGNPRIVSGTVDIGAYEYQGAGSVISYAWLQHYGLPTDGSADTLDTDMDGHNTWQEWKCWTDPTNALSVLRLLTPQPDTNGMVVSWQSVLGQTYSVGRATNASGPFSLLQGNFPGQAGTTSVTDTNPADGNPILYRVAVP